MQGVSALQCATLVAHWGRTGREAGAPLGAGGALFVGGCPCACACDGVREYAAAASKAGSSDRLVGSGPAQHPTSACDPQTPKGVHCECQVGPHVQRGLLSDQ